MTERIQKLLDELLSREYKKQRKPTHDHGTLETGPIGDHIECFEKMMQLDTPILIDGDDFGFNRSIDMILPLGNGNTTPNFYRVMTKGYDAIIKEIEENLSHTTDKDKYAYGTRMLERLQLCLRICEKHRELAKEKGNMKLYNALLKVPHKPAETFYEACVFIKLSIYFLRNSFVDHVGLGRFDRYMYPFYKADRARGVSDDEIFETLEAFFISLNYDTDLYFGIQQGDNGQSMVLGGYDKDGNSMYNELSTMCMKASLELSVIDPKINLRVCKNTPDEIYEYGTLLTKQGLGFPQYCNDDVVVPGLIKLGYKPEDAYDYTVAACWEFIIPGKSADVPNRAVMNFPLVINNVVKRSLLTADTFEALMAEVRSEIADEADRIVKANVNYTLTERPLMSVYMDGCIESLTDMWRGGVNYSNFGSHGAGIANGTDALAAIKKTVYDEKTVTKEALLDALEKNFEGEDVLRNLLRSCPKMGNNDDYADDIALDLMKTFAESLNNRKSGRGGIWRAGTGSAQAYIYDSVNTPATADGRKAGEPYSSSYSPSLDIRTTGLLSVIQSFTKFDLSEIINGGPLTIEIHDTVLRNDIGIKKTAMLVKSFIGLGGHQLQLNSINRDRLLDAQAHPENHPNLIVRVWGWSGYFNELDVEFQNHIIRRTEYME